MLSKSLLIRFFQNPTSFIEHASPWQWSTLVHNARLQGLLGQCYELAKPWQTEIPPAVFRHFESGARFALKQHQSLVQELFALETVFKELDVQVVLLKGAAYRLLGLSMARGRLFSDIDLLVTHSNLAAVVAQLQQAGFLERPLSDYDRHYYLAWSHQHPPLRHFIRATELDVHHSVFFAKGRYRYPTEQLMAQASRIDNSVFAVPCLDDLFFHACLHLFGQEELHRIDKDLIELWLLWKELPKPQELLEHAGFRTYPQLLALALLSMTRLFQQALPIPLQQWLTEHTSFNTKFVFACLTQVEQPTLLGKLARFCWLVRGYRIKMPVPILLYHLITKPWHQFQAKRRLSRYQQQLDASERPHDA